MAVGFEEERGRIEGFWEVELMNLVVKKVNGRNDFSGCSHNVKVIHNVGHSFFKIQDILNKH